MGGYRGYRAATPSELERAHRQASGRSQLVAPIAFGMLIVGLVFGTTSILIPALLGLLLVSATGTFLSMRLNPFSSGFYVGTKPSWTAIGVVAICGLLLLSAAWTLYRSGAGPILPGHGP